MSRPARHEADLYGEAPGGNWRPVAVDDLGRVLVVGTGGGGSDVDYYMHTQGTSSDVWTISHGLGFYPNVTTVNSAYEEMLGDVSYPDINTVRVAFSTAYGGYAFLS